MCERRCRKSQVHDLPSIRSFWRASNAKRRLRSPLTAAMERVSCISGAGRRRSVPDDRSLRRDRDSRRLNYRMIDHRTRPRPGRSGRPRVRRPPPPPRLRASASFQAAGALLNRQSRLTLGSCSAGIARPDPGHSRTCIRINLISANRAEPVENAYGVPGSRFTYCMACWPRRITARTAAWRSGSLRVWSARKRTTTSVASCSSAKRRATKRSASGRRASASRRA